MQLERQTAKTEMTTSRLNAFSVFLAALVEITKMLGFSNKKAQYEEKMECDEH